MGKLRWYKRYPDEALGGMAELTLEERGAYNTVIDLIYARDNNLPDDDKFIARLMMCDVRTWKRIRTVLMTKGKIYSDGMRIRNNKCDVLIDQALDRANHRSEVQRSYAHKSHRESSKTNDLAVANAISQNGRIKKKEEEERKEDPPLFSPPPNDNAPDGADKIKSTRHGSRISADWEPSEADEAFATSRGMSTEDIASARDAFIDYWASVPGQRGAKLDWSATWRNHIRARYERSKVPRSQFTKPVKKSRAQEMMELYDEWYPERSDTEETSGSASLFPVVRRAH